MSADSPSSSPSKRQPSSRTPRADSYPCEQGFVPENVFLERLHDIAVNAIGDACTGSNPRQPAVKEMEELLKCCYYDTEVDF